MATRLEKVMAEAKPRTEQPGAVLAALEVWVRGIAEEVIHGATEGRRGTFVSPADLIDEQTKLEIQEQVLISHKTYLTRKEAAKYLNVSERSIAEWAARSHDQNPFPESKAGSEPRTKRAAIDEWAGREQQRQRLKIVGGVGG